MNGTDSATPWRDIVLIVALCLLALAPPLFTRDPWNPDEPALIFWAFAAFYRLGFGIQGGRVVALLATMGTLLITYQLGRRLYGREVGLLAAPRLASPVEPDKPVIFR